MSGESYLTAFTCYECGTRYENLREPLNGAGLRIIPPGACPSCGRRPNPLRVSRIRDLEAENARLRIALHDAIRRPLGVTPDSALEFYDQRMADEAEARRPRLSDQARGGGDVG